MVQFWCLPRIQEHSRKLWLNDRVAWPMSANSLSPPPPPPNTSLSSGFMLGWGKKKCKIAWRAVIEENGQMSEGLMTLTCVDSLLQLPTALALTSWWKHESFSAVFLIISSSALKLDWEMVMPQATQEVLWLCRDLHSYTQQSTQKGLVC